MNIMFLLILSSSVSIIFCSENKTNVQQLVNQIQAMPDDQIVYIDNDLLRDELCIIANESMPIDVQQYAQEAFSQGYSLNYNEYRDLSNMPASHKSPFTPGDYILLGAHKELKKNESKESI